MRLPDLKPQDPSMGPPLPKELMLIWPKELKGPPMSLSYRAQSYASSLYQKTSLPVDKIVNMAKHWVEGVAR